ncbi:5'-methylthioadenosine/S-adenosylhomocysteine nucleosidase [Treponema sp.]|uniref:5'-methylthioadenosine/S-adenosylhomocysteine nucleosidase n=1 Tax=Treponema sp. TaxID=166 RepID=UPI0025CBC2B5|nr:5'-methylthioadenosine/S-adenosylhomocysteine nucleosidase [Treponema sp.]MBR4322212.1 5'-methylthioadenosine/S-adenosylhomocysteine nucleosidase [Treponema sp.]
MPKTAYTAAILAAIDVEIAYLSTFLDGRPGWKQISANEYFNEEKNLKLVSWILGPGKVNAAYGTADIINKYHPDIIVNVGVAGGFVKNARRGDVAIGTEYAQVDFNPFLEKNRPSLAPSPVWFIEQAEKEAEKLEVSASKGLIATGDFFLRDSRQKAVIARKFNPVAFDMESGAISQVASAKSLDFISIRTFSDFADEDAPALILERQKEAKINGIRKVTIEHSPVIIAVKALENRPDAPLDKAE